MKDRLSVAIPIEINPRTNYRRSTHRRNQLFLTVNRAPHQSRQTQRGEQVAEWPYSSFHRYVQAGNFAGGLGEQRDGGNELRRARNGLIDGYRSAQPILRGQ
jgi:hypothetical protein